VDLIRNSKSEYIRRLAASILIRIVPNNPTAITALEDLIRNSKSEYIRREAAISLVKIVPNNPLLSLH
jgi:HEAT repeat protein